MKTDKKVCQTCRSLSMVSLRLTPDLWSYQCNRCQSIDLWDTKTDTCLTTYEQLAIL